MTVKKLLQKPPEESGDLDDPRYVLQEDMGPNSLSAQN